MKTFLGKYFSPYVRQNEELSFLQIFKPLYFLVSALGLFPRSIKFSSERNNFNMSFKFITINPILTFTIPIVICVFYALHMTELKDARDTNITAGDDLTQANYDIQLATQLIVSTIIFICAFKYRGWYVNILNEIVGGWTDLPNSTRGSNIILGRLRVQVNCKVLGTLLLVLILQLAITCSKNASAWKSLLQLLTFVLPELIQFTLVAFYFVMVVMVIAVLKNVEEHFRILIHTRMIRNMRNDYVRVESGPMPVSLQQLRGVYARAQAAKRQLNAAFQAPLLVVLAQSFHTFVSNAHTLCHEMKFQNQLPAHSLIECFCRSLYQIMKFYTLGQTGVMLKLQANRIGRALHEIASNSKGDAALYLEVQHFSTLMLCHQTEISLYGFFLLEASFVFNALASAATYLVIFVQFDTSA